MNEKSCLTCIHHDPRGIDFAPMHCWDCKNSAMYSPKPDSAVSKACPMIDSRSK